MRLFNLLIIFPISSLCSCGYGLQSFYPEESVGKIIIDPSSPIEFGSVLINEYELFQATLIANGSVVIEDIYIDGDATFALPNELPIPKVMTDGDELPVKISFSPSSPQNFNAQLVIVNGNIEVERRITGTGCSGNDC
jgi:hypothetical protein